MNMEILFLFLILALSLLLFSFLGGGYNNRENFEMVDKNSKTTPSYDCDSDSDSDDEDIVTIKKEQMKYDNYNHYFGTSTQLTNGQTFYGKNGGTVTVNVLNDGTSNLVVKLSQKEEPLLFVTNADYYKNNEKQNFYGPNGSKAKIIFNDGQQYVNVETNEGKTLFTSINTDYSKTNDTPSTYFGSTGMSSSNTNNLAVDIKNPVSSVKNTNDYSSSLPPGIPKTQIPPGQEDLYILKTQVVPPVCPACPACPTCPACGKKDDAQTGNKPSNPANANYSTSSKYSEADFLNPKISNSNPNPNYNANPNANVNLSNYKSVNNQYLPVPVLSDFSGFGM